MVLPIISILPVIWLIENLKRFCRPAKPGAGVVHNLHGLKQGHREIFLYALYGTALEQIVGVMPLATRLLNSSISVALLSFMPVRSTVWLSTGTPYLSEGQASRQRLRG